MSDKRVKFNKTNSWGSTPEMNRKGYDILDLFFPEEDANTPSNIREYVEFLQNEVYNSASEDQHKKLQNAIRAYTRLEEELKNKNEKADQDQETIQQLTAANQELQAKLEALNNSEKVIKLTEDEYQKLSPFITQHKAADPEGTPGSALLDLLEGMRGVVNAGLGHFKVNGKKIKL